jgi:chromosome partitioning protein
LCNSEFFFETQSVSSQDGTTTELLRVMFDPRMTLQQQVSAQLEAHFGDKVFKTVVPRNVRLAEAPSYGMPGVIYDRASRGAQAYISFGAEMIERVKKDLK